MRLRRGLPAWLGFPVLASCGPSVVVVPLPPLSGLERTLVVSIGKGPDLRLRTIELADEGVTRIEDVSADDGIVVRAFAYPHSARVLRLPAGILTRSESGQPLARPAFAWQRVDEDEWRELDGIPRDLEGEKFGLAALEPLDGLVREVEVGLTTSCALRADGSVACWGSNFEGQLGRQSPPAWSASPLDIEGLRGVTDLSFATRTVCALLESRGAVCWGAGSDGTLGRGADTDGTVVRPVAGLEDAVQLVMGGGHACALSSSGEVACWGANGNGATGYPRGDNVLEPHVVAGIDAVVQLVAGYDQTCALRVDGAVWCWGKGDIVDSREPTELIELGTALEIAGGSHHLCARREDRSVWCVGRGKEGQLGASGPERAVHPMEMGLSGKQGSLYARGALTCVQGEPWACVGSSVGFEMDRDPVRSPDFLSHVRGLASSLGDHACSTSLDGTVDCWGHATAGEIGLEPIEHRVPVEVHEVTAATRVDAGGQQTCAFGPIGSALCFGKNDGSITASKSFSEPTAVLHRMPEARGFAFRGGGACVRTSTPSDSVWCWGDNANGEAGIEALEVVKEPTKVPGTEGALDVSSSNHVTCAVVGGGRGLCWGSNNYGQLGASPNLDVVARSPVDTGLSNLGGIALGNAHGCAFSKLDGEVFCWGNNIDGQLGLGRLGPSPTPESTGLRGAVQVVAGDSHTCARLDDGRVMCFGKNDMGQLGDGTRADRGAPTMVPGIDDAVDIAAGNEHTCVVGRTGRVLCFGSNASGQLGNGAR